MQNNIDKNEIWKDVVGYEGLYQVSNYGNIKCSAKIDMSGHRRKEIIYNFTSNASKGYFNISLRKNNFEKNAKVHRLVAQAFIPNIDNKPEVNHKNGIKTDNRIQNLEWATRQENATHASKNGLMHGVRGCQNKKSKLIESQIKEIRFLCKNKINYGTIAKQFGISRSNVCLISQHKRWSHIQ